MRITPAAVAIPRDADDLQALCVWASTHQLHLIARGSGSSMSGAAVGPGVVVDLHRLRAAPAVREEWARLTCGAATTRAAADAAARHHGLRFPVDPSSGAFATLGGMAATNAAGARTMAFGAMRSWVRGLECVFADGSRAWIHRDRPLPSLPRVRAFAQAATELQMRSAQQQPRQVRKDSSGYGVHSFASSGSLVDLLVGSEGTLAFFASLELDLLPLPAATATVLGSWPSLDAAVDGTRIAREAGAVACELLDASFLRIAARGRSLPVPDDSAAVLLVELEGDADTGLSARAAALDRAWRRVGASDVLVGLDPESEESLWALRHAASPILARLPHLRSMQVIEDGCVPLDRFAEYIRGVDAALNAHQLQGVMFGHAGDAHLHVNALVDVREAQWRSRIRGLFESVVALTASLGGTMAGEHGDGRLRSPVMDQFWSAESLDVFDEIKSIFDPDGLLNPGVKCVGRSGEGRTEGRTGGIGSGERRNALDAVFEHIKYDPADPLPQHRAREVLDEVERTRGYDGCRLELLGPTG